MDDAELRRLLVGCRSAAVYGMSRDPAKAAHRVPAFLIKVGYSVAPINPFADEIPRLFPQGLRVKISA